MTILRNTCSDRSRSPFPVQSVVEMDTDTLDPRQHRRRCRHHAAPSAQCALPGSWHGQVLLELAREVTLSPWLQWNSTAGPGGHFPLRTRLVVINHWRRGTAHIQGPSRHMLAERLLELHEALRLETRVLCSRLLLFMRFVRLLTYLGLPASRPVRTLGRRSPASTNSGSRTRSRRERESRSATSSRPHVSFMPPEGDPGDSQGFGVGCSRIWTFCVTLWCQLCRAGCALGRPSPRSARFSVRGTGSQHACGRFGRGRHRCPSAFGATRTWGSRPGTCLKSFFELDQGDTFAVGVFEAFLLGLPSSLFGQSALR